MKASSRQIGSCDNLFDVNVVVAVCVLENRGNRAIATSYYNRTRRFCHVYIRCEPAELIYIIFFEIEVEREAVFRSENFVMLNITEYELLIIVCEFFAFVIFECLNNNLDRGVSIRAPIFDLLFLDVNPVRTVFPIGIDFVL